MRAPSLRAALLLWLCGLSLPAAAQIAELENPGTVTAVQDRLYRMHHELSVGVGVLPLDAFYKGLTGQVSYTNHFTDHFAWQVGRASYSYNLDTGLRSQLERDFGVLPTAFDEVRWMVGSDLIWTPYYGKVAYLNESVSHFQLYLIGGASILRLQLATSNPGAGVFANFRPALNLGLGLRLFNSRAVSFRFEVTDNVVVSDRIFHVPTFQLTAALNFGGLD